MTGVSLLAGDKNESPIGWPRQVKCRVPRVSVSGCHAIQGRTGTGRFDPAAAWEVFFCEGEACVRCC